MKQCEAVNFGSLPSCPLDTNQSLRSSIRAAFEVLPVRRTCPGPVCRKVPFPASRARDGHKPLLSFGHAGLTRLIPVTAMLALCKARECHRDSADGCCATLLTGSTRVTGSYLQICGGHACPCGSGHVHLAQRRFASFCSSVDSTLGMTGLSFRNSFVLAAC